MVWTIAGGGARDTLLRTHHFFRIGLPFLRNRMKYGLLAFLAPSLQPPVFLVAEVSSSNMFMRAMHAPMACDTADSQIQYLNSGTRSVQ